MMTINWGSSAHLNLADRSGSSQSWPYLSYKYAKNSRYQSKRVLVLPVRMPTPPPDSYYARSQAIASYRLKRGASIPQYLCYFAPRQLTPAPLPVSAPASLPPPPFRPSEPSSPRLNFPTNHCFSPSTNFNASSFSTTTTLLLLFPRYLTP